MCLVEIELATKPSFSTVSIDMTIITFDNNKGNSEVRQVCTVSSIKTKPEKPLSDSLDGQIDESIRHTYNVIYYIASLSASLRSYFGRIQ